MGTNDNLSGRQKNLEISTTDAFNFHSKGSQRYAYEFTRRKKKIHELTKKMPKMTPCIDKVFLCIATYYNPTSLKEVKGLENV